MSGIHTGVGARFKRLLPHAVSMHCRSHNLSLAVLGKISFVFCIGLPVVHYSKLNLNPIFKETREI